MWLSRGLPPGGLLFLGSFWGTLTPPQRLTAAGANICGSGDLPGCWPPYPQPPPGWGTWAPGGCLPLGVTTDHLLGSSPSPQLPQGPLLSPAGSLRPPWMVGPLAEPPGIGGPGPPSGDPCRQGLPCSWPCHPPPAPPLWAHPQPLRRGSTRSCPVPPAEPKASGPGRVIPFQGLGSRPADRSRQGLAAHRSRLPLPPAATRCRCWERHSLMAGAAQLAVVQAPFWLARKRGN